MALSTRLATAVHILSILAIKNNEYVKSDYIADSVNTNPVVVRRILGKLNKSGIVCALSGANGGTKLNVSPEKITLFDIYKSVEDEDLFLIHEGNEKCPISFNLKDILNLKLKKVEIAMEDELKKISISEIFNETLKCFKKI